MHLKGEWKEGRRGGEEEGKEREGGMHLKGEWKEGGRGGEGRRKGKEGGTKRGRREGGAPQE